MVEKYLISRRKLWILLTEVMIDRSQYDRSHNKPNDKTFNQTYPNWFETALKENNIVKVKKGCNKNMKCKNCDKVLGNSEITLFNGTNRVIGHFCNKSCAKEYFESKGVFEKCLNL